MYRHKKGGTNLYNIDKDLNDFLKDSNVDLVNSNKKLDLDTFTNLLKYGIISYEDVQEKIIMKKKEYYLSMHHNKIWEDQNGKWYTYLPDESKPNNRRKVKKSSYEDLEKEIINFYKGIEKQAEQKSETLRSIYPKWLKYKSAHTDATNSISRYNADWKRFYLSSPEIIDKSINTLTVMELDLWIHSLIKEYEMTKTCYYNMSMIIRQCFDYAVDQMGIIQENTFRKVKIETKLLKKTVKKDDDTQVFMIDETGIIFNSALMDFQNSPNNTAPLAVMLTFLTGLRRGEVVALKEDGISLNTLEVSHMERETYDCSDIENIHYQGKEIIDGAKTEAGMRNVPLVPLAMEIIELVKEVNKRNGWYDEGFLFLNSKGNQMKSWQVKYRIEKYCAENNIKRKSFHKIRKTYISALIDSHISLNEIRKACGHSDERTTLSNYCFNRRRQEETYQQFNSALIQGNGLENLLNSSFAL